MAGGVFLAEGRGAEVDGGDRGEVGGATACRRWSQGGGGLGRLGKEVNAVGDGDVAGSRVVHVPQEVVYLGLVKTCQQVDDAVHRRAVARVKSLSVGGRHVALVYPNENEWIKMRVKRPAGSKWIGRERQGGICSGPNECGRRLRRV
jgi:hypothetical protein